MFSGCRAPTPCCLIGGAVGVAFPESPPRPRVCSVFGQGEEVWLLQDFFFTQTKVQEGKPTHGNTVPTTACVLPRRSHFLPSATQATGWPSPPHATATQPGASAGGSGLAFGPCSCLRSLSPGLPHWEAGVKATSRFRCPGLLCSLSLTFFPYLLLRVLQFPWAHPHNLDRPEI